MNVHVTKNNTFMNVQRDETNTFMNVWLDCQMSCDLIINC